MNFKKINLGVIVIALTFFACRPIKHKLETRYLIDGDSFILSELFDDYKRIYNLNTNGDTLYIETKYINSQGLDSIEYKSMSSSRVDVTNILSDQNGLKHSERFDLIAGIVKKQYFKFDEKYDNSGNLIEYCLEGNRCNTNDISMLDQNSVQVENIELGTKVIYYYDKSFNLNKIKRFIDHDTATIKLVRDTNTRLVSISKFSKESDTKYSFEYFNDNISRIVVTTQRGETIYIIENIGPNSMMIDVKSKIRHEKIYIEGYTLRNG
ncbi:MAG: hypothetical protein COA58_04250 [Bacteroidetes bacterium]|nr:MAG: hypothetical protein COA58_04250 [Bacteroidota bacterium]